MRARAGVAVCFALALALVAPATHAAESASRPAPVVTSARAPAPSDASHPPPISPIGFVIVCGWVLACLYCATWTQHRSVVAAEQKPVVNLLLLITGPLGLAGLEIARRNPKAREKLDIFLGYLTWGRSSGPAQPTEAVPLELCTSDGAPVGSVGGRFKPLDDTLELAKRLIYEAMERRSSDVLIDPRIGDTYLVRYRVDGLLHDVTRLPTEQGAAVVNCLKVASRLDISEKRRPQDGAFIGKMPDREVKFRTATAGTLYGEKIAVRIFDVQTGLRDIDNLGINTGGADQIANFMRRSDGMLLIAGPTGSGKTTTIYAALNLLHESGRNIVTIEDPIEYPLDHGSQTEVNVRAGITFASGLRSILRQDPDVILLGEIRDAETAETALQASQTGHLVVSTVHSTDGPTALARLLDFGIEPFLVTTGLTAVMSQRLVRVLCPSCKTAAKISAKLRREGARRQIATGKISVAVGCEVCDGTGYLGRTGIFEILPLSRKIGQLLMKKPSLGTIQAQARAEDVVGMRQRGMEKVLLGVTTVEEVLRVTT